MVRPRLQFRLSTLLWLTLAVACWCGGMRFNQWLVDRREAELRAGPSGQEKPALFTGITQIDMVPEQVEDTPERGEAKRVWAQAQVETIEEYEQRQNAATPPDR
jgi:hypothetical protein